MLEQMSYAATIVGTAGVILSLVFVGLQIRQNTGALQRSEHNNTMAQWTVIRMAIVGDRGLAELMTAGLHGRKALDEADELRLAQFLQENAWAAFHIWDRTQRGVFAKGTFEATAGALLCQVLDTPRGGAWWRDARSVGFMPEFVADVDAVLAGGSGAAAG
jgi:hypothetical protein